MTFEAEQKIRIVPASGKGRCCGANLTLVLDDYHDYLFEAISTLRFVAKDTNCSQKYRESCQGT
jgi:hypothetical protein